MFLFFIVGEIIPPPLAGSMINSIILKLIFHISIKYEVILLIKGECCEININ